jgi:serine/threonine-protein kinase
VINVENTIETHCRKLAGGLSNEFEDLYELFANDRLRILFSTLHSRVVSLFDSMNQRLPTGDQSNHFWAEPSRELIQTIEIIEALERSLKNSELAFKVDEYYRERLVFCKTFLKKTGGSSIPPNTEKMDLYYKIPIFSAQNSIVIESKNSISELKLIGGGSYAKVFKYFDKFYDKTFALKRAKSHLTPKELERFKREYQQMRVLRSPYILEVFGYNEVNKEYVMELMDTTLDKYISKQNGKLSFQERLKLGFQIIKAFAYIHSKNILHRDISPNNILLKIYDDVVVVKVADFGLVKIPDSNLTSIDTDLKGCFNDPNLRVEGFDNYDLSHETYALTRILYYVLTGKTRTDKLSENLKSFIEKGLNSDRKLRFRNVDELRRSFQEIKAD